MAGVTGTDEKVHLSSAFLGYSALITPNDDHSPSSRRGGKRPFRDTQRIIKPVPDADAALGNAWPAGVRTIACLSCDRPFMSSGRQERMCQPCRRHAL
jgi:hypothetical protein